MRRCCVSARCLWACFPTPDRRLSLIEHPVKPTVNRPTLALAALLIAAATTFHRTSAQNAQDAPLSAGEATNPEIPEMATPATDAANALPTFLELYQFSPTINSVLLGLSCIALMLFLFFFLTINRASMTPKRLVSEVSTLVVRKKYTDAGNLCKAHRRVFIATILQRLNENAENDPTLVMNIVETEGRRRADVIWNRISYLADIANIAPMIGLLGTVIGMIKAFFALDLDSTDASNQSLAQGVGEAMATTLFGLAVAITASVFYSIIKGRTTKVLAGAEQAVHTVADLIYQNDPPPRGVTRRVLKKKPVSTEIPPRLDSGSSE